MSDLEEKAIEKAQRTKKLQVTTRAYRAHTQPVGFTLSRTLELQAFSGEPGVCTAGTGTRARTTTFPTASTTNTVEIIHLKLRPWIRFIQFPFRAFEILGLVFPSCHKTPRTRCGGGRDLSTGKGGRTVY